MRLFNYFFVLFILILPFNRVLGNQTIPTDVIITALKELLRDENIFLFRPQDEDIEITLTGNSALNGLVEEEIIQCKLTAFDKRTKSFTAMLTLKSQGEVTVKGQFVEFVHVPVLTSDIRAGEVIEEGDIDDMKINVLKMRKNTVQDPKELTGKTPKYSIKAYKPIAFLDITNPKVINKNDTVTVVYNNGRIDIKIAGIAQEAGAIGDLIKIKNARSNSIISAVVINKNTAKILTLEGTK
jgi:flagella basal body P-ring formation protein FlgA